MPLYTVARPTYATCNWMYVGHSGRLTVSTRCI